VSHFEARLGPHRATLPGSSTAISERSSNEASLLSGNGQRYIELNGAPGAEAREIVEGLVVDLDANGDVVGFDIEHASRKLDLSKVETIALPPASAAE
jgi:uncharacterized protein YuzE